CVTVSPSMAYAVLMRVGVTREEEPEGGALPDVGLDVEDAAEHVRETPGDGQAQPGTAVVVASLELHEFLEDARLVLRRDAGPAIGDLDAHTAAAARAAAHVDRLTGAELCGVGQQVEKDLADAAGITAHRMGAARGIDADLAAALLRHRPNGAEQILDQLVDAERLDLELQLARLELAQIEDVVDELRQMACRFQAAFDAMQLPRRQLPEHAGQEQIVVS